MNIWEIIWNISEWLRIPLGRFAPFVFGKMIGRKGARVLDADADIAAGRVERMEIDEFFDPKINLDKISIPCTCGNCKNKLSISLSDVDAELLIYEIDEHHGQRMSVIVPHEIGMAMMALVRGWQEHDEGPTSCNPPRDRV